MLPLSLEGLVLHLHTLPSEGVAVLCFLFCISMIVILQRFFGALGLCAYNIVAVLAANLHALKLGQFALFQEPVALGTVGFASSFLVSDLLTEYYGKVMATKAIWLSFITTFLWMGLLLCVVGVTPISASLHSHEAMMVLFTPSTAIVCASLIAYLLSQKTDVYIFDRIKKRTQGKALWLRAGLSMGLSAFVDTLVFSTLAWVWFSPTPVSLETLWHTYIIGTFIFRLTALSANVGVMMCIRKWIPA